MGAKDLINIMIKSFFYFQKFLSDSQTALLKSVKTFVSAQLFVS